MPISGCHDLPLATFNLPSRNRPQTNAKESPKPKTSSPAPPQGGVPSTLWRHASDHSRQALAPAIALKTNGNSGAAAPAACVSDHSLPCETILPDNGALQRKKQHRHSGIFRVADLGPGTMPRGKYPESPAPAGSHALISRTPTPGCVLCHSRVHALPLATFNLPPATALKQTQKNPPKTKNLLACPAAGRGAVNSVAACVSDHSRGQALAPANPLSPNGNNAPPQNQKPPACRHSVAACVSGPLPLATCNRPQTNERIPLRHRSNLQRKKQHRHSGIFRVADLGPGTMPRGKYPESPAPAGSHALISRTPTPGGMLHANLGLPRPPPRNFQPPLPQQLPVQPQKNPPTPETSKEKNNIVIPEFSADPSAGRGAVNAVAGMRVSGCHDLPLATFNLAPATALKTNATAPPLKTKNPSCRHSVAACVSDHSRACERIPLRHRSNLQRKKQHRHSGIFRVADLGPGTMPRGKYPESPAPAGSHALISRTPTPGGMLHANLGPPRPPPRNFQPPLPRFPSRLSPRRMSGTTVGRILSHPLPRRHAWLAGPPANTCSRNNPQNKQQQRPPSKPKSALILVASLQRRDGAEWALLRPPRAAD